MIWDGIKFWVLWIFMQRWMGCHLKIVRLSLEEQRLCFAVLVWFVYVVTLYFSGCFHCHLCNFLLFVTFRLLPTLCQETQYIVFFNFRSDWWWNLLHRNGDSNLLPFDLVELYTLRVKQIISWDHIISFFEGHRFLFFAFFLLTREVGGLECKQWCFID